MSKEVTLEKLAKDFPELLNEPGSKYAGGIAKDYGLTENTPRTSGSAGGSADSRLSDTTPVHQHPICTRCIFRLFKRPVFIALGQIARNPFFFFRLVFLVTRRDVSRLARRVRNWARHGGD